MKAKLLSYEYSRFIRKTVHFLTPPVAPGYLQLLFVKFFIAGKVLPREVLGEERRNPRNVTVIFLSFKILSSNELKIHNV